MTREVPRLMAISDRRSLEEPFESWLRELDGRVDALQIREQDLTDRSLFELALQARSAFSATITINDRIDVALAAGCDGVHLPTSGLPIPPLRRRFGSDVLIGRSTHHPGEVAEARRDGADYAIFGPVFATPSKAAYGLPPGLSGLRRAVDHGLPVIAIGGIDAEAMAEVAAAGAIGVAAIRALQRPESIARMAEEARRLWPVASAGVG